MAATGWPEQLWVVRHAESVGNAARDAAHASGAETIGVATRDPDVALSERGGGQAQALGRWLARPDADGPPSAILTSPYRRTRETAAQIATAAGWRLFGALESGAPVKGRDEPVSNGDRSPIPVIVDERLREKDAGRLEGLTRAGIIARHPAEAEAYGQLGKFYYRPPGGESWCDVILRLRSLVDVLRNEYAGGRVLIVSHQVVVVCLRYILEGLDEAGVLGLERPGEVANTSLTRYHRAGDRLVLDSFNDVTHLASERITATAEPPAVHPLEGADAGSDSRDGDPADAKAAETAPAPAAGSHPPTRGHADEPRPDDPPPDERANEAATGARVISARLLAEWPLPAPGAGADKEARGRVLIVGGDARVPGGVLLAATAALRAGAGKLQLAVAAPVAAALAVAVPEALVQPIPATGTGAPDPEGLAALEERCRRAAVVIVGPGLVEPDDARELLARLAGWVDEGFLLVDAAALAGVTEELGRGLDGRLILTPNAAEAALLLDWPGERIADDPAGATRTLAARFGATAAIKGRETQIADPSGRLFVNRAGNVGLAISGSGDVLAGIIGGLAARGASALQATVWGVHLHARAADDLAAATGPLGYLPRELPARLPALLATLAQNNTDA